MASETYMAKMFKKSMAEFLINLADTFDEFDTELLTIRKGLKKITSSDLLAQYKERTESYSDLLTGRDEAGLRALGAPILIFDDSFDFMKLWNVVEDSSDEIKDTIWNYLLHFQVYSGRPIVSAEKREENAKKTSQNATRTDSQTTTEDRDVTEDQKTEGLMGLLGNKDVLEDNMNAIENASVNPETGEANEFGQVLSELTLQMTDTFKDNPEGMLSGQGIMGLMQNIATTLQEKQESGEIDMEKMAIQAQNMMGNLNLGGMEKAFGNMGANGEGGPGDLEALGNLMGGLGGGLGGLEGLMGGDGAAGGLGGGGLGGLGNMMGAVTGLMGEEAEEDKSPEEYKQFKSEVPAEFLDKLRAEREATKKEREMKEKSKEKKPKKQPQF